EAFAHARRGGSYPSKYHYHWVKSQQASLHLPHEGHGAPASNRQLREALVGPAVRHHLLWLRHVRQGGQELEVHQVRLAVSPLPEDAEPVVVPHRSRAGEREHAHIKVGLASQ